MTVRISKPGRRYRSTATHTQPWKNLSSLISKGETKAANFCQGIPRVETRNGMVWGHQTLRDKICNWLITYLEARPFSLRHTACFCNDSLHARMGRNFSRARSQPVYPRLVASWGIYTTALRKLRHNGGPKYHLRSRGHMAIWALSAGRQNRSMRRLSLSDETSGVRI